VQTRRLAFQGKDMRSINHLPLTARSLHRIGRGYHQFGIKSTALPAPSILLYLACERFRILGITFVAPTFRQFSYRYFHINFAFKRLQVGKNEAIQISSTANITSSYACPAGPGPSLEDSTPSFTTLTLSSYCRRGSLSF